MALLASRLLPRRATTSCSSFSTWARSSPLLTFDVGWAEEARAGAFTALIVFGNATVDAVFAGRPGLRRRVGSTCNAARFEEVTGPFDFADVLAVAPDGRPGLRRAMTGLVLFVVLAARAMLSLQYKDGLLS